MLHTNCMLTHSQKQSFNQYIYICIKAHWYRKLQFAGNQYKFRLVTDLKIYWKMFSSFFFFFLLLCSFLLFSKLWHAMWLHNVIKTKLMQIIVDHDILFRRWLDWVEHMRARYFPFGVCLLEHLFFSFHFLNSFK